ncbi:hypothetical protein [Pseudostreptobacillus hongkongensis]|uniref:hypothetical protein n=1 Tax=Pseudostreptobacillus hongkongensis TaxID=1162717 RepID=UPI000834B883|nr:hypothetical protein [Pseudostreptobacillus hongkongensis]
MKNISNKIPYFYNAVWFVLFENIKEYGIEKGYKKLLEEFKIYTDKYNGYLEITSAYINDCSKLECCINPDYFKFINIEKLTEYEKKIVFILASSMELRINKPIFELIYENISKENDIKGEYRYIIAKYILKYKICKNIDYVLKNLIAEIFEEHILYRDLYRNDLIIYTPYSKDSEKSMALKYIKKIFLKEGGNLKIYWGKHFLVIGHKYVSKLDSCVSF